MTGRTRVRYAQLPGRDGGYHLERVASHAHVPDRPRDFRHVTGHTTAARTGRLVLRVLLDRSARSRLELRAVALQTDAVARQPQVRLVLRSVDVVARGAPHAFARHLAFHVVGS